MDYRRAATLSSRCRRPRRLNVRQPHRWRLSKCSHHCCTEPLEGELFVGEPGCGNAAHSVPCQPHDAEDGNLFRLFLQVRGEGVTVKLLGTVFVNPTTGQVTASFREDPQLPFSRLGTGSQGGIEGPAR